jgi:putative PEP-CTERM system histidine kinase
MPDDLTVSAVLHVVCAASYLALVGLIVLRSRFSHTAGLLVLACLVTAAWAGSVAVADSNVTVEVAVALELLRSMAWYAFIHQLYRRTVPERHVLARTFATMGIVVGLMVCLLPLLSGGVMAGSFDLWSATIAARLGLAVCNILLLENLWRNTPTDERWHINLVCVSLGALFCYDIVLSADAILFRRPSVPLFAGRALATTLIVPLLALAARRNPLWAIKIYVSRTAAFHTATLVASGVFFLSLAAAGEALRSVGRDWGGVAETALIFAGVLTVAVLMTSRSARSRLRAIAVDHFFSHRFDYRVEWMRCIATLSAPDAYVPLHVRAIRAVAEVVDSPGGVLFLRDPGDKAIEWAGSWNMPAVASPIPPDHPLLPLLRQGNWIVEMATFDARRTMAQALAECWLAVPLAQSGRLIGIVFLAQPRANFLLDREVFDLLRTLGREVASFISERRMTEVLTQTRQLHEYGKRFAFVAHDIKNVSSQLSMLVANAEFHIQNPEFQRDMLATVRSSVQKIGALLTRLQEPERDLAQSVIAPAERIAALVAARRRPGSAIRIEHDGWTAGVAMNAASFDAVMTHLLDNAVEASTDKEVVRVRIRHDARRLLIDIVDAGRGMTPEFIRDDLFRPFGTSKEGGTGIGVFQSRELLRQAGGDLLVMSEHGVGTTMRLMLPVIGAADGEPTSLSA